MGGGRTTRAGPDPNLLAGSPGAIDHVRIVIASG